MEEKIIVQKKENNKGSIITIVVLILLLLGTSGYIVYDKVLSKNVDNTNTTKDIDVSDKDNATKKTEVDINSSLVQNLFNIFRYDKGCYLSTDGLNNINYVRLRIAYDNLAKDLASNISCSNVMSLAKDIEICGNMTKLMTEVYSKDMNKFHELEAQNTTNSIDEKVLEAKYHDLFGSEAEYKNESFGIGVTADANCYVMRYSEENKIYAYFSCEGGGTCIERNQKVTSAYKENDKLVIITELSTQNNDNTGEEILTVTYNFKKDSQNSNYVFVNAEEK